MKISTDGGHTWTDVEKVQVVKALDNPDELDSEILFNFTEEGLITDVWVGNVCEGTSCEMYQEIGDRLVQ